MLLNLATTGATEALAYVARLSYRRYVQTLARARSNETGRPLIVVGATGRVGRWQGGCGDLPCVDLRGCESCGAPPIDVSTGSIYAPDDSTIVCVAYALEHVDDVEAAWREIKRVAGDPETNVFVARLRGFETLPRLLTGARRIIDQAPPDAGVADLRYHEVRARGRSSRRGAYRRLL